MSENKAKLDDLLDIPVVAELLNVSPRTVNRLINSRKGELPAVRIGGRWKIRAEDIEKYLLKKSANADAYVSKADALHSLRRYEEALVAYEQVIDLDSHYAYAYKSKGDTLNSMGYHEEALVAYEHAIDLDSHYAYAYKSKGDTLNSMGYYEEALVAYEQAHQLSNRA